MDADRAKKLVQALVVGADALTAIAATAKSSRKSLTSGFYSEKFHEQVVALTKVERAVMPIVRAIGGFDATSLDGHLQAVKSSATTGSERDRARKQIRLICEAEVLPNIENTTSPSQP